MLRLSFICLLIFLFHVPSNESRLLGSIGAGFANAAGGLANGLADVATGAFETVDKLASFVTSGIEKVNAAYQRGQDIFQNASEVRFYLYNNPLNSSERFELRIGDLEAIAESGYNTSLPLIVITHGFMGDTEESEGNGVNYLKMGYFNGGYFGTKANVVLVDWSKMSGPKLIGLLPGIFGLFPSYVQAANNVYVAADKVSDFLDFVVRNNLVPGGGAGIHLVGHSLGAHVMGMSARHFKKYNDGDVIARLTGTDPAGPLFQNKPAHSRFDASHAAFVDAIHTNQYVFGYINSLAHVDFYVNRGGPFQPLCLDLVSQQEKTVGCSHQMAPQFFAASVTNHTISGTCYEKRRGECNEEEPVFGEGLSSTTRGSYDVELIL